MGELAVSSTDGDELVAIGLGSCIGLAMVDREAGVAGLAHVVLPESQGRPGPAAKFADLAVPELIARLERAGAAKRRLEAVLIGGARMFAVGASLDIGARNAEAVKEQLAQGRHQDPRRGDRRQPRPHGAGHRRQRDHLPARRRRAHLAAVAERHRPDHAAASRRGPLTRCAAVNPTSWS